MDEFRVTLGVRNNLLIQRREELGLSCKAFAAAAGVSYGLMCRYEALTESPRGARGGWKPSAQKIAAYHGLEPAALWPQTVLAVDKPRATRTVGADALAALVAPGSPEKRLLTEQTSTALQRLMRARLTPREEHILRRRFGFDGDPETLDAVGADLGLSGDRTRVIQEGALGKLRQHPALADFVDWDLV